MQPQPPPMASSAPFDIHTLFRPPTPAPNPGGGGGGAFPPPALHGALSYPPSTALLRPPTPYPPPQAPNPHPTPPIAANPHPNHGARLMALLGTTAPSQLESAVSMPPPPQGSSPAAPPPVVRAASGKAARGRRLSPSERAVFDVDARLPGEPQPPQLEVTPITKYASDPGLVLGRQIAVNRTYICYGLKLGAVRVLNINTVLRALLRGHTQKVTDMVFFAEDVHLLASASVDGRVIVWKIDEGPDEEDKPQIAGKVIIAIRIIGNGESYHPRVCWHSHKQEILMVGIGNSVLKIDTTKVGRGKEFSGEEPLSFPLDKLIDGVQLIGKHDGEVTDLSISQWMTTRLASASKDGTVKVWDERKALPLVTLRPHDGQPVNSVEFLTAPHRPDHIVLITAGPLCRELKFWVSKGDEGWLLPSESESWHCTQTLELRSSVEARYEEAFFNQLLVLPRASLIILANAKKNAIYAVHVYYGPFPASTRMDYIADFTVAMPILSFTGTSECFSDGEMDVQVYCVQTQAIQQYALDLSQCLPPQLDTLGLEKDSIASRLPDIHTSEGVFLRDPSPGLTSNDLPVGGTSPTTPYPVSSPDNAPSYIPDVITTCLNADAETSAGPLLGTKTDTADASSLCSPLTLDHTGGLNLKSSPKDVERGSAFNDQNVDPSVLNYAVERKVDPVITGAGKVPYTGDNSSKNEFNVDPNNVSALPNPAIAAKLGGNTTHLITPFEILSGAISSSESSLVNQVLKGEEMKVQDVIVNTSVDNAAVEVKVVGESGKDQHEGSDSQKEPQALPTVNVDGSQALEPNMDTAKECLKASTGGVDEARPVDDDAVSEVFEQPPSTTGKVQDTREAQDSTKDLPENSGDASANTGTQPLPATKVRKQKLKQSQGSDPSAPSPSPFNSTDSLNEPESSAGAPSIDAAFSQILTMQTTLNQLMIMQKEMQKQLGAMVAAPVTKEGRRIEVALGRTMEKAVKTNVDVLWDRFQEENAKHEKIERDHMQQLTTLITNSINKDFPTMLERALKKEISALGPNLARTISPVVEKTISSAIADSFQRCVGDKAINQLEKSVTSKVESTLARQIQAQFQNSGKQALQDALRSTLESSVVPAFERSCKAMFEQVDAAFEKGMVEHTTAAQQKLESTYTPLAHTLRDAIHSASSITQNVSSELLDGQRKILALVTGGTTNTANPMTMQQNNGPLGGHSDMVEPPLDPKKELTRLISEHKFGDAFTLALHRSDVSIVSWLCSQVDLQALVSMHPSPLNQGVLLSLLQQLACDISNETIKKLDWMTAVASAILPGDPLISGHVRRIIEQVYNMVGLQRAVPTTTPIEASKIRLLTHVLTSILMNCK